MSFFILSVGNDSFAVSRQVMILLTFLSLRTVAERDYVRSHFHIVLNKVHSCTGHGVDLPIPLFLFQSE